MKVIIELHIDKEMVILKIAFIGDLHYPTMDNFSESVKEARDEFYSRFLQSFFEIEADYYVSIGDLTNYGNEDEIREVYQLIDQYNNKKFIHTLGNHDLYGIPREEVLKITNMEQNVLLETDEVNLLFLETARDHDFEDYSGYLDEEQLQWLENVLDQTGEKTAVIFAHHPVYDTTANSNYPFLSIAPELPVLDILRKKQGTGIYVNGHNHKDSILSMDQWTFIQTSAVLDDPSIRVLDIEEEQISIKAINVGNPELKRLSEIIGTNIPHFQHNPEGIGTTPNREKTIKKRILV